MTEVSGSLLGELATINPVREDRWLDFEEYMMVTDVVADSIKHNL